MRKFILVLLLSLLAVPCYSGGIPLSILCGQGSSASSCTYEDGYTGGSSGTEVAYLSDGELVGTKLTPTGNVDVCGFEFYVESVTGDLSGKDTYIEIWTLTNDGTSEGDDLVTRIGLSEKVEGSAISASDWTPTYSFSPAVSLTSGTTYAFVGKTLEDGDASTTEGKYDASNYWQQLYNNNNYGGIGRYCYDSTSGLYSGNCGDPGDDINFRIYIEE